MSLFYSSHLLLWWKAFSPNCHHPSHMFSGFRAPLFSSQSSTSFHCLIYSYFFNSHQFLSGTITVVCYHHVVPFNIFFFNLKASFFSILCYFAIWIHSELIRDRILDAHSFLYPEEFISTGVVLPICLACLSLVFWGTSVQGCSTYMNTIGGVRRGQREWWIPWNSLPEPVWIQSTSSGGAASDLNHWANPVAIPHHSQMIFFFL